MILENEKLKVEISAHGAEPTSIFSNGRELLWNADPKFWKRHAPILFPIVGQVYGGKYRTPLGEYELSQHGIARDLDFEQTGEGEFTLVSTPQTKLKYPYDFKLTANYSLKDATLIIRWSVLNTGDCDMLFQIGAHPAFNFPDFNPEDEIHGYMRFYDKAGNEVHPTPTSVIERGFRIPAVGAQPLEGPWPVKKESFDRDAVLLEGSQVYSTVLLDKAGVPVLKVDSESPALGLWGPVGQNAPFVCIEPWMGITDALEYDGAFSEKDLVMALKPGESKEFRYDITAL